MNVSKLRSLTHLVLATVILVHLSSADPLRCEEIAAAADSDSTSSLRWGGIYSGLIDLRTDAAEFPWNDPSAESHISDRLSLMVEAAIGRYSSLFLKGATGYRGDRDNIYKSRFLLEQGHISAGFKDYIEGRLFLRERVFRNRTALMLLVSNDSPLISRGGEGLAVTARPAGDITLLYAGAVFRDPDEQKENGGLPTLPAYGDYLNIFEAGLRRRIWHMGLTLSGTRSQRIGDSVMYGLDGGFDLAGGRINLEFAKSSEGRLGGLSGGFLGIDFDKMQWGHFSTGLPSDGALAAEWTGFVLGGGRHGRFGLIPGYRYSGMNFTVPCGEVRSGYVESYLETWWKHPSLAALVTVKAADRYDYNTGAGGGVLSASLQSTFRGGLETRGTVFFADGYRPVLVLAVVDDNSLTRLSATARIDDAGGRSEFSFLTEGSMNLGRSWTLGGTLYLERSVSGYYAADLEFRSGKRFVFSTYAGTFIPSTQYVSMNFDPSPNVTDGDRMIAFFARIWLGRI